MARVVVRRGLGEPYYRFLQVFAAQRHLEVMLDRRRGDRRQHGEPATVDRRRGERRQPPPRTWDSADFIILKPNGEE